MNYSVAMLGFKYWFLVYSTSCVLSQLLQLPFFHRAVFEGQMIIICTKDKRKQSNPFLEVLLLLLFSSHLPVMKMQVAKALV